MRGLILIALASGCTTYAVHRAALAPHPEPVLHPAAPLDGAAELGFGATSLAHLRHIGEGNPDAAVESPGTQFRADARFALSDTLVLGLTAEDGLAASSQQEKPTQPPVDEGDVHGAGVEADIAIPTRNPALRIGLHFDITAWRVPFVEWQTCIDFCPVGPFTIRTRGHDTVGTVGVGATPSYRVGTMTWFGGLTAKQHPTIEEKGTETIGDFEDDVKSGPFNWIVSAGVEVTFGTVKGVFVVYQDISQDPVIYYPSAAAMVVVPLGTRAAPPPPPVTPQQPYY